jgi:hypothetical protein
MSKELTETRVKKTITHDYLSMNASFPSGATFRWSVGRTGERLSIAFANDEETSKRQAKTIVRWLKHREEETNEMVFERLEVLLKSCKSGKEVVSKMESDL